jgi:hypothetical protein
LICWFVRNLFKSICHIQFLGNSWDRMTFWYELYVHREVYIVFHIDSVNQAPDYQEDVKPLKPPPLPPFYQDSVYSGAHHAHPPPPGIEPVTLPTHMKTEPPPPGTDIEGPVLPHNQTQVIMEKYQSQPHSR